MKTLVVVRHGHSKRYEWSKVHVAIEKFETLGYRTLCRRYMYSALPVSEQYTGGVTCRVCAARSRGQAVMFELQPLSELP
jgi:hypothetical protein